MPKRMRARVQAPDYWSYIFEIEDWEPSYLLSINDDSRFWRGPYWEHLGLELTGTFVHPERAKGRKTTFTVRGDREIEGSLVRPDEPRQKPRGVASITMRGDHTEVYVSAPQDSVRCIANMLACSRFRFLVLHGEALYRGKATITSMHFARNVNLDEY